MTKLTNTTKFSDIILFDAISIDDVYIPELIVLDEKPLEFQTDFFSTFNDTSFDDMSFQETPLPIRSHEERVAVQDELEIISDLPFESAQWERPMLLEQPILVIDDFSFISQPVDIALSPTLIEDDFVTMQLDENEFDIIKREEQPVALEDTSLNELVIFNDLAPTEWINFNSFETISAVDETLALLNDMFSAFQHTESNLFFIKESYLNENWTQEATTDTYAFGSLNEALNSLKMQNPFSLVQDETFQFTQPEAQIYNFDATFHAFAV